jgi:hypothetical protein
VDCTDDTCSGSGTCAHVPNDALCTTGTTCDAQRGCVACRSSADCDDQSACTTDSCDANGVCHHEQTQCPFGERCCPDTGLCAECCSSCDCGLVVAAPGDMSIPPEPLCAICVEGRCQASQLCGC